MKDQHVLNFMPLLALLLLGACSGDQPGEEPIIVNIPDSDAAGADGVTSDADVFRVSLPYHETVSAGWAHSCLVRSDGRLNCFGLGSAGDAYGSSPEFCVNRLPQA